MQHMQHMPCKAPSMTYPHCAPCGDMQVSDARARVFFFFRTLCACAHMFSMRVRLNDIVAVQCNCPWLSPYIHLLRCHCPKACPPCSNVLLLPTQSQQPLLKRAQKAFAAFSVRSQLRKANRMQFSKTAKPVFGVAAATNAIKQMPR